MKKYIPKLIVVITIMIVVIIVFLSLNDISQIGKTLRNIKISWIFAAIGLLFLYMILNPISLFLLGRGKEEPISFTNSMMIGSMEYFFNGITPFSAGGQPFQIYAYNQIGVKPYRSSGMILMNFVATQLSIVILCLFSLFYFERLTLNQVYLKVMIWVGLVMNLFILGLFVSVGVSKTLRRWASHFVNWFFHFKIFKGKMEKQVVAFEQYCDGAQSTFKSLSQQKLKFLVCILLKLSSLILYYLIPFFILKALGIEVKMVDIPLIVAMTTFAVAMTCYIPTPGAAGGIEFAFQSLFITLMPVMNDVTASSISASGVLMWRFITYYLLMLLSFLIYLMFENVVHKKNKEKDLEKVQEM